MQRCGHAQVEHLGCAILKQGLLLNYYRNIKYFCTKIYLLKYKLYVRHKIETYLHFGTSEQLARSFRESFYDRGFPEQKDAANGIHILQ